MSKAGFLVVLGWLTLIAPLARAGEMVQPAGASSNVGNGSGGPTGSMRDQSGLSESYVHLTTDFDSFSATHQADANATTFWTSPAGFTSAHVDFNLAAPSPIQAVAIWGVNTTSSIREFRVLIADNTLFSNAFASDLFTANMPAENVANVAVQKFVLPQVVTGQYVRLDVQNNYGGGSVAIGEVAFATPEPASAGLLGVVVTWLLGRRYRRRPTPR